jgi:hypothetical protein
MLVDVIETPDEDDAKYEDLQKTLERGLSTIVN